MSKKYEWTPVEEMDLDDGTHTCYSSRDTRGNIIWLTEISNDTWDVEMAAPDAERYQENRIITLVNCKTLTSAKRWAARYI